MSCSHLHSILISPRLLLSVWMAGFAWEHYRVKGIRHAIPFCFSPSTTVFGSKPVTQAELRSHTMRKTSLFRAWIKSPSVAQCRTLKALPLSFGLGTSPRFPPHLVLHTYTLQLVATQYIEWKRNWGLGARWRLHRYNGRGKQRERESLLPSDSDF